MSSSRSCAMSSSICMPHTGPSQSWSGLCVAAGPALAVFRMLDGCVMQGETLPHNYASKSTRAVHACHAAISSLSRCSRAGEAAAAASSSMQDEDSATWLGFWVLGHSQPLCWLLAGTGTSAGLRKAKLPQSHGLECTCQDTTTPWAVCTFRGPPGVSTAYRSYRAMATRRVQVVHSGMWEKTYAVTTLVMIRYPCTGLDLEFRVQGAASGSFSPGIEHHLCQ